MIAILGLPRWARFESEMYRICLCGPIPGLTHTIAFELIHLSQATRVTGKLHALKLSVLTVDGSLCCWTTVTDIVLSHTVPYWKRSWKQFTEKSRGISSSCSLLRLCNSRFFALLNWLRSMWFVFFCITVTFILACYSRSSVTFFVVLWMPAHVLWDNADRLTTAWGSVLYADSS